MLVLTDKSSLLSRSLLKRSSSAVLIQQVEKIGGNYAFDLKATVRDTIVFMALGGYFSRWHVSASPGGFVRAQETTSMHKNVAILHQVPDSTELAHFFLPLLRCVGQEKNNCNFRISFSLMALV